MPIIGMTDRGAAFPRIGELRKGGEKTSATRPGPDLDYFRFTSKDPDALAAFTAAYGDKPRAINCYLPYATADENFEAWIEEWQAGGLVWRGDGQTTVMWRTPQGQYSQERKPQPAGGKQVGRLKIIIPELERLAYVTALTTSTWDIMDMASVLEGYQALRGSLQGIPFVLSRVPRMVSTPAPDGKRARREKWLWHLEAQPIWVQAQLSAMQRAALPSAVAAPLQLTGGNVIDMETGEITEDDYEDDAPAYTVMPPVQQQPPSPPPDDADDPEWVDAPEGAERDARDPDEVRAELFAAHYANGNAPVAQEKQLKYARSSLGKIFKPAEAKLFLKWVFKIDSSKELTVPGASAIIDWIGATKDNGYTADPIAVAEARAIYTDAVAEEVKE